MLVLRYKAQRQQLKSPLHLSLMLTLTLLGPVMAIWGYQEKLILAMIFGLLGTTVGAGFLRYSVKATLTKLEWWIEHLGAMIGSGIACYTAFSPLVAAVCLSTMAICVCCRGHCQVLSVLW
ncbi:hypothetical protein [Shewanella sp.]|uniref:hypothetical protein n=1 Tax=Shewanella sp. TaxID=50422 RepID=UPI003A8770FE